MSVNYAAGLSPYDHKGKCGLAEIYDNGPELSGKIAQLAQWINESKHLVVHTGAGVSTSAGIPDFRGPKGVWTLEAKGQSPEISITFDAAVPTFTHMALTTLEKQNILKYLITQNVDGLHLRSGFPRDRMSELHGNMFVEQCSACSYEHIRSKAVSSVGQKFTGKTCERQKRAGSRYCRGKLKDTILDWEANLPEFDLALAEHQSKLADLSICLGSTLQIVPAGNLPVLTKKNGGRLVIVNLQPTKQDKHADLIIHAKVDDVMQEVLSRLNVECEQFCNYTINLNSINGPPDRAFQAKIRRKSTQNNEDRDKQQQQSSTIKRKRKQSPPPESKKIDATQNFIELSCGKIEQFDEEIKKCDVEKSKVEDGRNCVEQANGIIEEESKKENEEEEVKNFSPTLSPHQETKEDEIDEHFSSNGNEISTIG